MSENLKLGSLITTEQHRDAIHIAVAPVLAGEWLTPGQRLRLADGVAFGTDSDSIGVADPFLQGRIPKGAQFWLFLNPGSITSLRHEWGHPAFAPPARTDHEAWMRKWAMAHMSADYYGDGDQLSEDQAYANAMRAGSDLFVGPYESAPDSINGEWWGHWEAITGRGGQRGAYFSCSC